MNIKPKIAAIEQLREEISAHGKLSQEVLKKINYRFRLDWNYYSNRMEGGTLTPEETRSVMVGNVEIQGKPLRDVLEMNGHDKVVLEILKLGKGEVKISEKRIKGIHKSIMHEDDPDKQALIGNWKKYPNELINYKDEKIAFTPPSEVADEIHTLIDKTNSKLEAFFSGRKSVHPLEIASQFHITYVTIHPFYDGNGRTARILTNLLLISCGFPPVIIKDSHKETYYRLLADIQVYGGDPNLFSTFLADRVLESQQLVLAAIEGKELREPDDLDKELQQIEIKLKNEEAKVVRRAPELVMEVFEKSIKPLSDALYEQLTKFSKFFTEFEIHTFMDGQGNSGNKDVMDAALPEYFKNDRVNEITINYQWGGFNRAGAETFFLGYSLKVRLSNFDYRVNEQQVPKYKPGLKKLYSQQLTQKEINDIVDEAAAKTLAEMKERYKQVTGKEL